ncbi:hypothetical protein AVDCRST_MAG81-4523, partial [uncultured Synechococcales cyanobacterium]
DNCRALGQGVVCLKPGLLKPSLELLL